MGDELYAGLLPWIVFAVVARSHGPSTTWAALAAVITAATILTVETKHDIGLRNTLVIAAIGFFLVLGAVSLFVAKPSGWYAQDARAVSALGFSAIAFGSLAFVPITEYYSRPNTRPSEWRTQPFRRVNVLVTLLWGTTFLAIAASHALAAVVDSHAGFTTLNWVLPIALRTGRRTAGTTISTTRSTTRSTTTRSWISLTIFFVATPTTTDLGRGATACRGNMTG